MSVQATGMDQNPSTSSGKGEKRNALVFRMPEEDENAPRREQVEEEDSFYDLTFEEFRVLYNDVQKQKAINDQLLIKSKREEEESKLRPHKAEYNNTVIRIEFPDRMILQGQFKIHETISDVKELVRDNIKEPDAGFDLFTSPPKSVLAEDCRLIDLKLVPSAKVYIALRNGGNCQLVSDRTAVVPFECAQEAARNLRRPLKMETSKPSPSETTVVVQPRESDSGPTPKKIPKWFKMKK